MLLESNGSGRLEGEGPVLQHGSGSGPAQIAMGRETLGRGGGEGAENEALATSELQVHPSLGIALGKVNRAVHGMVEHHLLRLHAEGDEGIDVLALKVGHEIVEAIGIGATDATEPLLGAHGFRLGLAEAKPVAVGGRSDDAALSPEGLHGLVGMEEHGTLHLRHELAELVLLRLLAIARHGDGEGTGEDDLPALLGYLQEAFQGGKGHEMDIGDDDGGIPTSDLVLSQESVGDVIHIVAALDDGLHSLDELGRTLRHAVDVEERHRAGLVVEHVVVRQIHEHVVVGLAPLKERLASLHVLGESGHRRPPIIIGSHIDTGIKPPSGPRLVLGRIAGTMENDVVDTRQEHEVEVGLALGERRAEMLGEPSEGLGRRESLPRHMSGRGSVLEHGDVGVVLLGEALVLAKSEDAEVAEPKALALGNIHSSIDIEQISWTTMRLVPRDAAVTMRPIRPLRGEVLQEKFAERLTVIAHNATVGISAERVLLVQYISEGTQVISPPLLKLVVQARRPVRPIHLIGIIEHRLGERHILIGKRPVEALQVMLHGIAVEVIYHQPLASRRCTLHLLLRLPHERILMLVKDNLLCRILLRHQRTTKRPPRARRHVGFNPQCRSPLFHILQHTHPTGRKIRNVVSFIPLHPIDGRNLHAPNAHLGKLHQVRLQPR